MRPWEERYRAALDDPNVRDGLLAFQRSWRLVRDEQFDALEHDQGLGFDDLRRAMGDAKRSARADLDATLDRFLERAEEAGTTVTTAATADAACETVARLCHDRGIELVVKGKSMVSEEIGLNDHLDDHGITAVETDLGEWLIQLAGEHPSHLVLPVIHKRRGQIATLLASVLGRPFDPDDVGAMVAVARTELRDRFLAAGMGITGANALIAETGTTMLVSNEGNGRLTTTLPRVHVILAGLDKLVPTVADAMTQLRLLARSATGQTITTYTSFVTGPAPGQEQHLVLVDNGRTTMAADPVFADALNCIRCGACADVCPPYQVVGGHGFGHVYTGAIGLVVTPFHHGLDVIDGPQSLCVSCGACTTVCPADIPLADQILAVRHREVERRGLPLPVRAGLAVLSSPAATGIAVGVAARATAPLASHGSMRLPLPSSQRWRRAPALDPSPARARVAAVLDAVEPAPSPLGTCLAGEEVSLFLQCVADRLAPSMALDTARVLARLGAQVHVPDDQHCCGLPAFDLGDRDTARTLARRTIESLEATPGTVVTPAASCVAAVVHDYPTLFADDPAWAARAAAVAERMRTLAGYLGEHGALDEHRAQDEQAAGAEPADPPRVAVHRFCQSTNVLGAGAVVESTIESATGTPTVALRECETCCGFGGSTSILRPDVAAPVLARKLACVAEAEADVLVTDNPGCALHLRGGAAATGLDVEVLHLAEYLARVLATPADP